MSRLMPLQQLAADYVIQLQAALNPQTSKKISCKLFINTADHHIARTQYAAVPGRLAICRLPIILQHGFPSMSLNEYLVNCFWVEEVKKWAV